MNRVAQEVADLGFRVFTRAGGDTYAYFTDGQHIGYVQRHEVPARKSWRNLCR